MIESWNEDHTGWALFSDDEKLRFRLGRSLNGEPLVINGGIVESDACAVFLMLNPSKANAFKPDPTVKRGMGFARSWGCDVYQAVNIHPLRSTDPDGLYDWTRSMSAAEWSEIQQRNLEQILQACEGARIVIPAWGVHGEHLGQGNAVREFMRSNGVTMHHLGLTKAGYPKHPLYLLGSTEPQEYTL